MLGNLGDRFCGPTVNAADVAGTRLSLSILL